MLRVIREVKPQWVVGENVRGLLNWNGGMVFHEVCADLENIGYEVQAFIIPASGINAPHQRERLWITAKNTLYNGCLFREFKQERAKDGKFGNIGTRDTNGIYLSERFTTNTDNTRTNNGMQSNREWKENDEQRRGQSQSEHWENGINGNVTKSKVIGRKNALENRKLERERFRFGNKLHTWNSFPSQSPVCSGDDGISHGLDNITFSKWRNESIKGYGNAVVPQVVYRIFKTIEYIQNLKP
jgi:DNA (cytosine-5)-methyltransferase 1